MGLATVLCTGGTRRLGRCDGSDGHIALSILLLVAAAAFGGLVVALTAARRQC